jgi:hypothetical protein
VKHSGTRLATGGYRPTASKSTYSAVNGEQVVLQWRSSAADRLVGWRSAATTRCVRGPVRRVFEHERAEPDLRMGEAAAGDCGLQGVRGSPELCIDLYRIYGYVLCGLTWLLMTSMQEPA